MDPTLDIPSGEPPPPMDNPPPDNPRQDPPCAGPLPQPDRPKFSLFFSPPATIFILLSLSWCLLVDLVVLMARTLATSGPPGLAHDNPRTPNVHILDP